MRTHEPCAVRTRVRTVVGELKVTPWRKWHHFAVDYGAHIDNQHPFGVTLTISPINPFAEAYETIPSGLNRGLHTTHHQERVTVVTGVGPRRDASKIQVRRHCGHIQPAATKVQNLAIVDIEREHP